MSEFEKWFKKYEVLANSHGFEINEDTKCQMCHAWLGALKWAKGQGCVPASILEREIEELKND